MPLPLGFPPFPPPPGEMLQLPPLHPPVQEQVPLLRLHTPWPLQVLSTEHNPEEFFVKQLLHTQEPEPLHTPKPQSTGAVHRGPEKHVALQSQAPVGDLALQTPPLKQALLFAKHFPK